MAGKVIQVIPTVTVTPKGREGLMKGEDGSTVHDDSWLHHEVLSDDYERNTNRAINMKYRTLKPEKDVDKSLGLYIDLGKSMGHLNTSKLVKKPIQVHGKNGTTFTRMQWVDATTGQPVAEHNANQKAFIDQHVKQMSTDEKYKHLMDHKVEWKHNDHAAILHKNKVEAVKQHLYKNPHLAGAEHLPTHEDKNSEGTDRINEWSNNFAKNDREKLYQLMSKFGIADQDPKVANPDDKAHPIKHMHNMMKFKGYLKDNPHHMEDPDHQPSVSAKPKANSSTQTRAEKGGNTIEGVMKSMSRAELYSLMKQHGIAEADPLEVDPNDKVAPIKHMRNMQQLKKFVETSPHVLNLDENFSSHGHEAEQRAGMDDSQKHRQSVKDFLDSMSPELKHSVAKGYSDHPIMKNRIKSEHSHVDNMHKVSALRQIFEKHPELMDKHKGEANNESLMKLTIGNKNMARVLRQFLQLKGVGDVRNVEPGVEWAFGDSSFVRREMDDSGKPILSVVDTGKDGESWDEHTINLSEVKTFLEGGKSSDDVLKSLDEYEIINWG
jgi:hypothetical protein